MAAHPRMAAGTMSMVSGKGATAVEGTTAYSARPPMEYMATGSPSGVARRVVPS